MKKIMAILPMILCILVGFCPTCAFITNCFNYTFILYNDVLTLLMIMIFFSITTYYLYQYKTEITHIQSIYAILLLPLSMINNIYFMMQGQHIILLFICCFAIFVCSIFILRKCSSMKYLQMISGIISGILTFAFLFVVAISLLFKDFGEIKIVQSLISPNQNYEAQVIVSDQGALGGNTYVDIFYLQDDIELLFGRISKHSKRVYEGEWLDYQNIDIYWGSEDFIIVNGKGYSIDE